MGTARLFWVALSSLLYLQICTSLDVEAITGNDAIRDGDVLVSNNTVYALGFFSVNNSTRRYVGIWYNRIPEQTMVWVANRDSPINGTLGHLSIDVHGNLALYDQRNLTVWSTNATATSRFRSTVRLLDSGNLVVVESGSGRVVWQSFDHPSNTMVPNLKIGVKKKTRASIHLISWKSKDDPGTGNYTYGIEPGESPQLFLRNGRAVVWRVGPWTGQRWSGVPEMTNRFIFTVTYVDNEEEVSVVWGLNDPSVRTRMVLDETGQMQRMTWHEQTHKWIAFWAAPKEKCDSYAFCGPNGVCDANLSPDQFECACLPGFKPRSPRDWYLRDGSGGCVRQAPTCGHGEGFVKVERVKVPDTSRAAVEPGLDLKTCQDKCLANCSCWAYTSADESTRMGCVTWHTNLTDTRTFADIGQDLYVRVDAAHLAKYRKSKFPMRKRAVLGTVVGAALGAFVLIISLAILVKKRKGKGDAKRFSFSSFTSGYLEDRDADFDGSKKGDFPFFDLSMVAAATDNFSFANKLGEGGFGSVYKGRLSNGKEIAVKRLSKHSGQGIEEFKNEVTLIAKLQHRNLVRILGLCVEGEEKMLIYEFMPNKSLDSILFDEAKRSALDWRKRFEIICGIARGMLYLHQDSRLRIVHRDLKPSNVLLDAAMEPKISDFGMARIFGADQLEANTNRVVGTYGYMSPEYAMEGLFSVKSDVYSFGVLLLEIVAGRKNSSYHQSPSSNLVGHVWELWKQGNATDIVDPQMNEPYPSDEVLRCIQIALLCVQERATDRPTMSTVIFMLGNTHSLPSPNEPAFILKKIFREGETITTSDAASSVNEVTVTMLEAR